MPTTDEKNILKILEEEGGELGELHEVKISKYMGLRLDYLRTILGSMGRRNLIDVFVNGKVKIMDKGWRALGKNAPSPWRGLVGVQESKPEAPEEKYKRWMSGKAKEEPATEGSPAKSRAERGERSRVEKEKPSKEKDDSESPSFESYADLPAEERLKRWISK